MSTLSRFGVSIEQSLLKTFDRFIARTDYTNRSEAVRDLIRARLLEEKIKNPDALAYGVLTLVYNHHQRELAERLTETQHHHHRQVISTTHVHISHDLCLEVVLLNGSVQQLRTIAAALGNYKGVLDHHLTVTTAGDHG